MERIEPGFFAFRRDARDKKKVGKNVHSQQVGFSSLLRDEAVEAGLPEELAAVEFEPIENLDEAQRRLDRIHELGDELMKKRTFTALRAYKHAVQSFLKSVVEYSISVEEHTSGSNILNRKRFAVIKVVDEKLQRLAIGLVQTQGAQLDLLRKVEEINGLLVDLLH